MEYTARAEPDETVTLVVGADEFALTTTEAQALLDDLEVAIVEAEEF